MPLAHGLPVPLTILLIEDDPQDAFLVEQLLADAPGPPKIIWVRSIAEGQPHLTAPGIHCVFVDLSLPDASGLEALQEVLAVAPDTAILVLTGLNDVQVAIDAVAAGAQDYLVKQEIDERMLARAIRYAIERKRGDVAQRELVAERLLAQETARLEHGLLPTPMLHTTDLHHQTSYLPGRAQSLLAGDFWDTVETRDGSIQVLVGDVCGHGPDEAALGAALRIAWRTLVLAGRYGNDVLSILDTLLRHERNSPEIFTTLCTAVISPSLDWAQLYVVGHPPPLVVKRGEVSVATDAPSGPPLGIFPDIEWLPIEVDLGDDWTLLLYTDGLIEATVSAGGDLLGTEGLVRLVREQGGVDLDKIITRVKELHEEELTDDLAAVAVSRKPR
ncbi:SpoIIE family protein phosphatase [Streptosporangiaceae bacterium NEAU-GS5]|nr:SpoIIE family protein phosphatase [Streptosporangiaceae bacterium NEAU-GS5]